MFSVGLILAAALATHAPAHPVPTHHVPVHHAAVRHAVTHHAPTHHASVHRAKARKASRHAGPQSAKAQLAIPVFRIDSLIATEQRGRISIEAKGAVMGGGWKHPVLKATKSGDSHVLALDFVAQPPPTDEAVIPGLLPVSASASVRSRKSLVSVRVASGSNEITTQILKAEH